MSDLIDNLPKVRPYAPGDGEWLTTAARSDGHTVVRPTHVIEKEGKIVGYASILPVVLLNTWLDSKALKPRESFHLINMGENLAHGLTGLKTVVMPCAEQSPFLPLMERLGYTRMGTTTLNVKG